VEQVARWPWNAWPDERGLGGRMVWNPHAEHIWRKPKFQEKSVFPYI